MMTQIELEEAVQQLARSKVGVDAMQCLLTWFEADGLRLDYKNKRAVLTLLGGAWGQWTSTTCDLMRQILGRTGQARTNPNCVASLPGRAVMGRVPATRI